MHICTYIDQLVPRLIFLKGSTFNMTEKHTSSCSNKINDHQYQSLVKHSQSQLQSIREFIVERKISSSANRLTLAGVPRSP